MEKWLIQLIDPKKGFRSPPFLAGPQELYDQVIDKKIDGDAYVLVVAKLGDTDEDIFIATTPLFTVQQLIEAHENGEGTTGPATGDSSSTEPLC